MSRIESKSFWSSKALGVTALFALCGAFSSWFYEEGNPAWLVILPVPFAWVCVIIFACRATAAIVTVLLIALVWLIACVSSVFSFTHLGGYYLAICIGGVIGGLGVALSLSIGHVFRWRYVIGAALIGCLAALPFGLLVGSEAADPNRPHFVHLALCFAIWQSAVGSYLYAFKDRRSSLPIG